MPVPDRVSVSANSEDVMLAAEVHFNVSAHIQHEAQCIVGKLKEADGTCSGSAR